MLGRVQSERRARSGDSWIVVLISIDMIGVQGVDGVDMVMYETRCGRADCLEETAEVRLLGSLLGGQSVQATECS